MNEPRDDNHTPGEVINPYLLDRQTWPNAVEIPTAEAVAWQRAIARVMRTKKAGCRSGIPWRRTWRTCASP